MYMYIQNFSFSLGQVQPLASRPLSLLVYKAYPFCSYSSSRSDSLRRSKLKKRLPSGVLLITMYGVSPVLPV